MLYGHGAKTDNACADKSVNLNVTPKAYIDVAA